MSFSGGDTRNHGPEIDEGPPECTKNIVEQVENDKETPVDRQNMSTNATSGREVDLKDADPKHLEQNLHKYADNNNTTVSIHAEKHRRSAFRPVEKHEGCHCNHAENRKASLLSRSENCKETLSNEAESTDETLSDHDENTAETTCNHAENRTESAFSQAENRIDYFFRPAKNHEEDSVQIQEQDPNPADEDLNPFTSTAPSFGGRYGGEWVGPAELNFSSDMSDEHWVDEWIQDTVLNFSNNAPTNSGESSQSEKSSATKSSRSTASQPQSANTKSSTRNTSSQSRSSMTRSTPQNATSNTEETSATENSEIKFLETVDDEGSPVNGAFLLVSSEGRGSPGDPEDAKQSAGGSSDCASESEVHCRKRGAHGMKEASLKDRHSITRNAWGEPCATWFASKPGHAGVDQSPTLSSRTTLASRTSLTSTTTLNSYVTSCSRPSCHAAADPTPTLDSSMTANSYTTSCSRNAEGEPSPTWTYNSTLNPYECSSGHMNSSSDMTLKSWTTLASSISSGPRPLSSSMKNIHKELFTKRAKTTPAIPPSPVSTVFQDVNMSAECSVVHHEGPLLGVSPPDELSFVLEKGDAKEARASMTLTNQMKTPVGFKVKSTSPEKFLVKPSCGVVKAGEPVEVVVTCLAENIHSIDKDKFQILALEMPARDFNPRESSCWSKAPEELLMQHRLKCSVKAAHMAVERSTDQHAIEDLSHQMTLVRKWMTVMIVCNLVFNLLTFLVFVSAFVMGEDVVCQYLKLPVRYCSSPYFPRWRR